MIEFLQTAPLWIILLSAVPPAAYLGVGMYLLFTEEKPE